MAINPDNSFFQQQWGLKAIKAPEAYQILRNYSQSLGHNIGTAEDRTFGHSKIIIAFVDRGIETQAGVPIHEAFLGNVSDGSSRIAGLYDFVAKGIDPADSRNKFIYANNDRAYGAHGSAVASIAAAGINMESLTPFYDNDSGVVGVAGNCRILSISMLSGTGPWLAMYWAANLTANQHLPQIDIIREVPTLNILPPAISANVISLSLGIETLSDSYIPFDLTVFGGKGRGILLFAASSNEGVEYVRREDRFILVGATKIQDNGTLSTEIKAAYSNYSSGLDLTAPAGGGIQWDPGWSKHRSWVASPRDGGEIDTIGSAASWNLLLEKDNLIDTRYKVLGNEVGLFPGQFVSIGDPVNSSFEFRRIESVVRRSPPAFPDQIIEIQSKFDNSYTPPLNLLNVSGRVAYAFVLSTTVLSTNSVVVAGVKGLAPGYEVYILDVNTNQGEYSKILSIVGNTITLDNPVSHSYPSGSKIIKGYYSQNNIGASTHVGQDTSYPVADARAFYVGQNVRVRSLIVGDTFDYELGVYGVNYTTNIVSIRGNKPVMSANEVIIEIIGGGEYATDFDGTSAATPIASGVAALVLSANIHRLSWLEVRHIMRESAFKIDIQNTNPIGRWLSAPPGSSPAISLPVVDPVTATIVEIGQPETALTSDAVVPSSYILVASVVAIEKDTVLYIYDGTNSQFAAVTSIVGLTLNLDRDLEFAFLAVNTKVKVGRKAVHSKWYGYGRVDASRAVAMAKDWVPADRDLWVRDHIGDLGGASTVLANIDCPDMWVRTVVPSTDGNDAIPPTDNDIRHQNPILGQDAWIYVKIRNRGTQESIPGMEIVLSLTNTADNTNPLPFDFPDRWFSHHQSVPFNETTQLLTPINGKMVFPSIPGVFNGDVKYLATDGFVFSANPFANHQPGYDLNKPYQIPPIPPGGSHVAIFPWRSMEMPVTDFGRIYLKVHITPFDGADAVSLPTVQSNNNLSFKQIQFKQIKLEDGGQGLLEKIETDTAGTLVLQPFNVGVYNILPAQVNYISITVTMRFADSTPDETCTYAYSGMAWSASPSLPTWLDFVPGPPTPTGASTPFQELTTFIGSLVVNNQHALATFEIEVIDGVSVVMERTFEVKIVAKSPTNPDGAAGDDPFLFQTFTDFDQLPPQVAAGRFGSISSTRYRTAAMFSGIGSGSQLKAYAVTRGRIFIQEIAGHPNQINLIQQPDDQPVTPYGRVKYFVYRGIRKDSYLQTTGAVRTNVPASNNDYLNRIWALRLILDGKELLLNPSYTSPGVKRDDLGLATSPAMPLPGTTPISEVFDTARFQIAEQGMYIGEFDVATTTQYGFQIIVDGPYHEPVLDDVRNLDPVVNITYTGTQPQFANGDREDMLTTTQREQVLSYLDPAAFIGLVARSKIKYKASASTSPTVVEDVATIYTDVLTKFDTKDCIYVDVRNELNASLNYFGNYGDGSSLNATSLQFLDASNTLVDKPYHKDGWPILVLNASDFAANGTDEKVKLSLSFPNGDNTNPMLFLAGASLYADFPGQNLFFQGLTPGATHSNLVELGLLNHPGGSVVMPAAVKLVVGVRYDLNALPPVAFPASKVLRDDLWDTIFAPEDIHLVAKPGQAIWDSRTDLRYSGWSSGLGFDFTLQTGLAIDDIGETAYAFVQGAAELAGGTSKSITHVSIELNKGGAEARSFLEHLSKKKFVRIAKEMIGTTACLRVEPLAGAHAVNKFQPNANDLVFFGYTLAQKVTIEAAATVFLAGTSNYFMAQVHSLLEDGSQHPYFELSLAVQGIEYDAGASTYKVSQIPTGLTFYSLDGLSYFTEDFATAVAPQLPY